MEFVQIIEYQTSKPDEIQKLGEDFQAARAAEGGDGPVQVLAVKDRDRENTYMTIVRFPSYEVAMANSQRPETGELAGKMAALCDGPPTFRNLDVIAEM
jgi:hypothetical protein